MDINLTLRHSGGQATSGTPSTNKGKERAHPEPQNTPPPPPAEHHGSNL